MQPRLFFVNVYESNLRVKAQLEALLRFTVFHFKLWSNLMKKMLEMFGDFAPK